MKEEDNSINVGGIYWKIAPRPFSTGIDPYNSKFPRFDEYEPGTILEIDFEENPYGKPFLILVIPKLNNGSDVIGAITISNGIGILDNYNWDITHQEVKKGGLKSETK